MDVCKSKSELVHIPLPEDDPRQRKPDISRAQKLLGWNPTIQLKAGLEKTVAYFRPRILGEPVNSQTAIPASINGQPRS